MEWNKDIDIDDAGSLRQIIVSLTDGVYNSSDTAAFSDSDIELIDKIRNFEVKS